MSRLESWGHNPIRINHQTITIKIKIQTLNDSKVASCAGQPHALRMDWCCILIWSRYWYMMIWCHQWLLCWPAYCNIVTMTEPEQTIMTDLSEDILDSDHFIAQVSCLFCFTRILWWLTICPATCTVQLLSKNVFDPFLDYSSFCVCGLDVQNEVINEQWMMPRPKMSGSSSDNSSQKRILPISAGEPKVQSLLMRRAK